MQNKTAEQNIGNLLGKLQKSWGRHGSGKRQMFRDNSNYVKRCKNMSKLKVLHIIPFILKNCRLQLNSNQFRSN
eukprot:2765690-Amphidinium_carterae.1